jgi:hypothetical protein
MERLPMTDERDLSELMTEMERVGVDPNSFPAGIDVSREEALRALATLDDGAGPSAFLAAIRDEQNRVHRATS